MWEAFSERRRPWQVSGIVVRRTSATVRLFERKSTPPIETRYEVASNWFYGPSGISELPLFLPQFLPCRRFLFDLRECLPFLSLKYCHNTIGTYHRAKSKSRTFPAELTGRPRRLVPQSGSLVDIFRKAIHPTTQVRRITASAAMVRNVSQGLNFLINGARILRGFPPNSRKTTGASFSKGELPQYLQS
jgi:hypothetical protein